MIVRLKSLNRTKNKNRKRITLSKHSTEIYLTEQRPLNSVPHQGSFTYLHSQPIWRLHQVWSDFHSDNVGVIRCPLNMTLQTSLTQNRVEVLVLLWTTVQLNTCSSEMKCKGPVTNNPVTTWWRRTGTEPNPLRLVVNIFVSTLSKISKKKQIIPKQV